MNTEQREEIESAIKDLEDSKDIGVIDSLTWPEISTLIQFARQQLNLRVDGENARGKVTSYCKNCRAVTEWLDSSIGPVSMCAGCGLDCWGKPIEQVKAQNSTPRYKPVITVDGEKLMAEISSNLIHWPQDEYGGDILQWDDDAKEILPRLVLECLTTTPEEKE